MNRRRFGTVESQAGSSGPLLLRIVLILALALLAGGMPWAFAQDEDGGGASGAARLAAARTPEGLEEAAFALRSEWDAATAKLIEIGGGERPWPMRVRAIQLLGEVHSEQGLVWCARRVRTTFPLGIRGDPRVLYVPAQTLEHAGWAAVPAILRHVTEGTPEEGDYAYLADVMIGIAGHEAAAAIVRRHGEQTGLRRGEDAAARVKRLQEALGGLAGRRLVWPPPPPPAPAGPVGAGPKGPVPPPRTTR